MNAGSAAVIGLGLDLVEIDRVSDALRRHGDSFAARICTENEIDSAPDTAGPGWLAGRFAAKEACLKALGTGWAKGLAFRQVEVIDRKDAPPEVRLVGAAGKRAEAMGVEAVLLSVSRQAKVAGAMVILLGSGPRLP